MSWRKHLHRFLLAVTSSTLILFVGLLMVTLPAFSHGGKEHGSTFTPLQALQKATELYDELVASGKLSENWEIDLVKVDISNREKGGQKEHVVAFQRKTGQPDKVYIFFSADGKYAGSNFTGK